MRLSVGQRGQRAFHDVDVAGIMSLRRAPLDADQQTLDGRAWIGVAAEVETGNLAPRERYILAVDRELHSLGIGRDYLTEELVAAGEADLVLGDVSLHAADWLGILNEAKVIEATDRRASRRGLRLTNACETDLSERAPEPLAMGQLVTVDTNLTLTWPKTDVEAVPTWFSGQTLHGQRGTAGRLYRQALFRPSQDDPNCLGAIGTAERQVNEPLRTQSDRAGVVKGDLHSTRTEGSRQPMRQRDASRHHAQGMSTGDLRLLNQLRLADDHPSIGVEGFEAFLKDQRFPRPLHQRDDA